VLWLDRQGRADAAYERDCRVSYPADRPERDLMKIVDHGGSWRNQCQSQAAEQFEM